MSRIEILQESFCDFWILNTILLKSWQGTRRDLLAKQPNCWCWHGQLNVAGTLHCCTSLPDSKRYSVCIWFKHKGPWQYIVIWQTENENGLLIFQKKKNGFVRLHYQTKHMCPRKIQLRNSTESLYRRRRTGWCDWTAVFFSALFLSVGFS